MIENEPLDLVGDILEPVDDLLEMDVDFAADDEGPSGCCRGRLVERLEAGIVDLVGMPSSSTRRAVSSRMRPELSPIERSSGIASA
jgi:hypothetical protein